MTKTSLAQDRKKKENSWLFNRILTSQQNTFTENSQVALPIGSELSEEDNQIDQVGKTTGFIQPQFAAPKIQDQDPFLPKEKKEEYK